MKSDGHHQYRLRGFGLMEILIAATLLAMVGLLILQNLTSSVKVRDRVEAISDRYHVIRQAMGRMSREIMMAYLSGHKNATDMVVDTVFQGEKSRLLFTAFGNTVRFSNIKQGDQRLIEYTIGKDPETEKEGLLRREKLVPGKDFANGGVTQLLCPDIKSISFEYWDREANKWDSRWSVGSATGPESLPKRVRITLKALVSKDVEQQFMTESEVWVTQPISIK